MIGSAASAVITETRTTAPRKAPTPPGTASQPTFFQSTLPNLQCETPDDSVVPTSAMWTLAEASAGEIPTASKSVVEVTPYAIPKEPSTSWAIEPTIARTMMLLI